MANEPIKLTTLSVRDQPFDVYIDPRGRFSAVHAGRSYGEFTLEGLRQRLFDATRRARVQVALPFTDRATLRDGVIVGIHQGTDHFLVCWEGKAGSEQEQPGSNAWLQRLSADNKATLRQLQEAKATADQAVDAFIKPRLLQARKLVSAAIEAKVRELAAQEKE